MFGSETCRRPSTWRTWSNAPLLRSIDLPSGHPTRVAARLLEESHDSTSMHMRAVFSFPLLSFGPRRQNPGVGRRAVLPSYAETPVSNHGGIEFRVVTDLG